MIWRIFRRYFVTGVLVLLPIIITIYVIIFAFNLVDGILHGLIIYVVGRSLPGSGFLAMLALVLLAGLFATNVVGRRLLGWGDGLLKRIPVVKSIYTATKQVMEAFALQRRAAFKQVAVIEYPRRGCYAIGLITGDGSAKIEEQLGIDLVNIYVPATPPTHGFFLMLPRDEVHILDMSVEEGLKLLLSAGIITSSPSYREEEDRLEADDDLPVYRRQ